MSVCALEVKKTPYNTDVYKAFWKNPGNAFYGMYVSINVMCATINIMCVPTHHHIMERSNYNE